MRTGDMGRGGADIIHDGAFTGGVIPSPDEVFDMFEKGAFDPPNPLAVAEGAEAEELPVVAESDVTTWEQHVAQSVHRAGKRATWQGRRDVQGRTFADREKPFFTGRYVGKAEVTPQLLETEYGSADFSEISQVIT